ncbi:GNAT family protein [Kineosporia mesophila]|uniref:GNAT family protein n=1 Tax=Kineosporia mesophila TaxID=566012 RepID=A0ABP7A701_9ACTN|nr:GNAT family N-acetyltransferase [Kineosporia mesophila]
MTNKDVVLRAVGVEDLPLLEQWRGDREHETEFGDFLPMARRQNTYQDRWYADGLLGEDEGVILICHDGLPIGSIGWHPVGYGPNRGSQALNIGISIAPGSRGKGIGSIAQRLAYEWLFRHIPVHRVEASTDVENFAEQKALEKAGFTREGILRGAQFRRGEWHDMVSYSRLRSDH